MKFNNTKNLIALLTLAFAATASWAGQGGESGHTSCLGKGNANSPCGVPPGTSSGGSSGTSVSNVNAQQQGQQQGQSQSSRNTNTASSRSASRASSSATGAAQATSGGNSLQGGQVSTSVGGDTYYQAAQDRNPVATAYAAPLTSSNGTCMGSSSAGAQGAAVGLSFGTTWTDASCDVRYDAMALRDAGLPEAARARLCQKADIAKAMEAAGTPCPGRSSARAALVGGEREADATPIKAEPADPIVRARLGLPPL